MLSQIKIIFTDCFPSSPGGGKSSPSKKERMALASVRFARGAGKRYEAWCAAGLLFEELKVRG